MVEIIKMLMTSTREYYVNGYVTNYGRLCFDDEFGFSILNVDVPAREFAQDLKLNR